MSTVIDVIIKIMYIILPVLLGYLVWLLKEERTERKDIKTEQSATTLGIKEILGYMIDRYYSEIMLQGYITTDQRNTIEGVFVAYAANKGNGARKKKYEELMKIKIDDSKPNVSLYYQMLKENYKKDCINNQKGE
jgi:hypothetical protein|nr:MAG TPA: hypothetical protein [Caudoviricetes sp.]